MKKSITKSMFFDFGDGFLSKKNITKIIKSNFGDEFCKRLTIFDFFEMLDVKNLRIGLMQFKGKSFLHTVHLVFLLFACLMIANVWKAYSRKSGNTGLDMAKIKELRHEANVQSAEVAERS